MPIIRTSRNLRFACLNRTFPQFRSNHRSLLFSCGAPSAVTLLNQAQKCSYRAHVCFRFALCFVEAEATQFGETKLDRVLSKEWGTPTHRDTHPNPPRTVIDPGELCILRHGGLVDSLLHWVVNLDFDNRAGAIALAQPCT